MKHILLILVHLKKYNYKNIYKRQRIKNYFLYTTRNGSKRPINRKKKYYIFIVNNLKTFAETNGDFSKLAANEVYTHLQNNQ